MTEEGRASRPSSVTYANAATYHRIDIDVELGVFRQHLQFLVEHLKTLFRHVVGLNIVDRNLHVIEPSTIQALNSVRDRALRFASSACSQGRVDSRSARLTP